MNLVKRFMPGDVVSVLVDSEEIGLVRQIGIVTNEDLGPRYLALMEYRGNPLTYRTVKVEEATLLYANTHEKATLSFRKYCRRYCRNVWGRK